MQAARSHINIKQTRCTVPSLPRPQQRASASNHACKAFNRDIQQKHQTSMQQLGTFAASAIIAIAAVQTPLPASAALVEAPLPPVVPLLPQTVPVSQMTQMAKPLPKQENIDKGKVWTVFIGGAASLFLVTVAAENNKSWFPAIARANEAMALARKRAEQAEKNQPAADIATTAEPAATPNLSASSSSNSAAVASAAVAGEDDNLPPLEVESSLIEAEIERRNALAAREAEAFAAQAELARQQKLVEEGLLSAKKKVLNKTDDSAVDGSATTSKVEDVAGTAAAATAEHTESSSSSSNGSSSSSAGYTVVAEHGSEQQGVAWQAETAAPAAVVQGVESKTAVSAAALNGLLESRDLMQQYREQQLQQQQEQEVRK